MIDAQHPKYAQTQPEWQKIEDITRRKNLHSYLMKINPHDESDDNKIRNQLYRTRAVFYALTGQTVAGMLGTLFRKWPSFTAPERISYLSKNADGAGNSIYQQAQSLSDDIIRKSRAGLFVTFPQTEGQVSQADTQSGRYVSTIHRIEPEQVINWSTTTVGAETKMSLVVIKESRQVVDDYKVDYVDHIRELYLDGGVYRERHWEKGEKGWIPVEEFTPTDAAGKPWREIPFIFVGSENNDPDVDMPNMGAMCDLNIAHYRNSADYEDSVWFAGQAQPWMSNVDQAHIDLMKENKMYVGSRTVLAVPEGGQFAFAAAPPNPLVRQAMLDKVDMMIGLGARMMTPGKAAKTAEEAAGEREVQHSTLSLIASNVSEAYTQALKWIGKYMGVEDDDMEFTINQEFVDVKRDPIELREIMLGWIQGTIPIADYVRFMQRYGIFDQERDAEEYAEELRVPDLPELTNGIDNDDGIDPQTTD